MTQNIEAQSPQTSAAATAKNRGFDRFANSVRLLLSPPQSADALLGQLSGKRVAIVGNALSLGDKTYGADIDAHDLVVRFNGVKLPREVSHGRQTDWVATAIAFPEALAQAHGVRTVLWMTPNRKNLAPWMVKRGGAGFYLHSPERHADLGARLGAPRPSTGVMVIDLVMQSADVKVVSVFGFDFFASTSLSGAHTAASAPHDFAKERVFVQQRAAADPRLVLMT